MSELVIVAILLAHFVSYAVVAWRTNARIKESRSPDRIGMFFVGPRSLANLWRLLFGLKFVRSGDLPLIVASTVHLATTLSIVFILIGWLLNDVRS